MIKFNLAKLNENEVTIDNTHEAFNGTEFADKPFKIELKRIKRTNKIDIQSESIGEDGKMKFGTYTKKVFVQSIIGVDGFVDENNEPITLEDGIREIIFEYGDDLLVNAIKNEIEAMDKAESEKKSELPTGLEATPIG